MTIWKFPIRVFGNSGNIPHRMKSYQATMMAYGIQPMWGVMGSPSLG